MIFNNEDVRESPVEGAFEGNFACEVEVTKSIKHISKNNPKSSKIPDYTRRAHVLREFRKRTCKHENKRKSYKSSDEIAIIGYLRYVSCVL